MLESALLDAPPAPDLAMPAGEPLGPVLRERIDAMLERLGQNDGAEAVSDLVFSNLWLFRRAHRYQFHEGEMPCISGHTYDDDRHLIALFDLRSAPVPAVAALLAQHDAGCFYPVSARTVATLDPVRWECWHSRDDSDYLYPAEQFRQYRGATLRKKRNLTTQLHRAHRLSHRVYQLSDQPAALHVLHGWMADKRTAPDGADALACQEALAHADALGLKGFLHLVDGEAAGFVLAQRLRPGVMVMRFAKGLERFKGIYQHMFQHFCQHAEVDLGEPVSWLNFEQDMGLPNFRSTKLSYQPTALLPKFRARPR